MGTGVASSTYPAYAMPGSRATIRYGRDQRYVVRIGAADIRTGTRTALAQIAADALDCPVEAVRLEIGDTDLPMATVEGGSSGINCWGSAIVAAARAFRDRHGADPAADAEIGAEMPENPEAERFAIHSFGAQFAEVQVHADTGEIRVPRMLGVFSVGRIINPRTARSQLIGGMIMGLSMALHEESVMDPRFGHVVNHDFAGYHIAVNADVKDIDAIWLDEVDAHSNPMDSRGIDEIGIVGAAAIANAAYHATGIRVRDLLALLDALEIERALLAGYDWGGRAACIAAALRPERVGGLVSVNGYNIQNIAKSGEPGSPENEYRLWYQYYFHSARGRAGLARNHRAFCKLLWRLWSPRWAFDDGTYERSAASFDNPDFVEVSILVRIAMIPTLCIYLS